MRSSRLLEMLLLLQTRGQVTAAELARRLEVSPRTVYRDADALSAAGVPVYAERGRGGGIRLLPGYRTDVSGLTSDEARALFVLTTGAAQQDLGLGPSARSAIVKVMKALPAPFQPAAAVTSERILVDPQRWMRGAEPTGALGALQQCVFDGRRVRLEYRSSGQPAASVRTVDPYGLVCKAGVWYLVADAAGQPRLFRVSRVVSAQPLDEPTRWRGGMSLGALWEELRQQVDDRPAPVAVRARVRRAKLDMLRRICAANLAEDAGPDGGGIPGDSGTASGTDEEWAEVALRFPAVIAARTLLSFGTDVTVLSPAAVREDLCATAAAIAASYAQPSRTPAITGTSAV